jgi:Fur family transcriptional regulator, peroxide stress response regulator
MGVFRALERAEGHPTAEQLHLSLKHTVPGLALKTVYAILHELTDLRLIAPLPLPGGPTHWEQNSTPHGHLVCDVCRRLVDLPVDPTVLMPLVKRAARGFDPQGASLIVHGRCERCGRRPDGQPSVARGSETSTPTDPRQEASRSAQSARGEGQG